MKVNSALLTALAFTLSACAGKTVEPPEPVVEVQEVLIEGKPAPCVPKDLGPRPDYVDSDDALAKAVDAAVRYALLWAGREERINRERELEAVIEGCPKEE